MLDGGPCGVGIESTIVDFSRGRPVMLRPGGMTVGEIESVLGETLGLPDEEAPRVSGSLPAHYAPKTPARLVATGELDAQIARYGNQAAVLAFSAPDERIDYWLRMPKEPGAYAQKTPRSRALHERAKALLSNGVTHIGRYLEAHPVYVQHAAGSECSTRSGVGGRTTFEINIDLGGLNRRDG